MNNEYKSKIVIIKHYESDCLNISSELMSLNLTEMYSDFIKLFSHKCKDWIDILLNASFKCDELDVSGNFPRIADAYDVKEWLKNEIARQQSLNYDASNYKQEQLLLNCLQNLNSVNWKNCEFYVAFMYQ